MDFFTAAVRDLMSASFASVALATTLILHHFVRAKLKQRRTIVIDRERAFQLTNLQVVYPDRPLRMGIRWTQYLAVASWLATLYWLVEAIVDFQASHPIVSLLFGEASVKQPVIPIATFAFAAIILLVCLQAYHLHTASYYENIKLSPSRQAFHGFADGEALTAASSNGGDKMSNRKDAIDFDKKKLPTPEQIEQDFKEEGYAEYVLATHEKKFRRAWQDDDETSPQIVDDEFVEFLHRKK